MRLCFAGLRLYFPPPQASLSLKDRLSQNLSEIARDGSTHAFFAASYKLYKRLVGPTLKRVSPHLVAVIDAQSVTSCVDLFFWAVFMGDVKLARELWVHVDHPLHCALLASNLLHTLSRVITAGQQEAQAAAEEIESWATGVLNEVAEQELAHWLLSQRVKPWRLGSIINLALQMELKAFLAHRHCQSLMDLRWRGGFPDSAIVIKPTHTLWQIFMWAFVVPFANPYLYEEDPGRKARARRKRKHKTLGASVEVLALMAEAEEEDDAVDREDLLLGALAEAMLLKRHEKGNAVAPLQNEGSKREYARKTEGESRLAGEQSGAQNGGRAVQVPAGAGMPAAQELSKLASKRSAPSSMRQAALAAVSAANMAGALGPKGAYGTSSADCAMSRDRMPLAKLKHSAFRSGRYNAKGSTDGDGEHSFVKRSFGKSSKNLVNQGHRDGGANVRSRRRNGFYSVPLIKYLLRAGTHVLFLMLYAQVLSHLLTIDQLDLIAPALPPLSTSEAVLIMWSLTLGYEHRRRELTMRDFGLSTNLPLKTLINTAHIVLAVAIVLRLTTLVPGLAFKEVYTAYQMLVSFDAVLMMCELFSFMWTSLNFGVLTITLVQMMVDLGLFVVFFSVVLVGFCLALVGLSETAPNRARPPSIRALANDRSAAHETLTTAEVIRRDFATTLNAEGEIRLGLVWQPFWAMFAEFDLDELSRVPFGLPLMWVYVLIANVVLVNMLIAMFAETYARIKRNAFIEYRYQHYLHIFEYQYVVHAIPPPFNFPLLILDTCSRMCSSRESRRNLGRMNLDDGYENDPTYGPPNGMSLHEGMPIMHKYVQRYLKFHTELSAATSNQGIAMRIERDLVDMEERMSSEFEHLASQLTPSTSNARLEQKINLMAVAIDRMIKGKTVEATNALQKIAKDKARATSPSPSLGKQVSATSTTAAGAAGRLGTPTRANSNRR